MNMRSPFSSDKSSFSVPVIKPVQRSRIVAEQLMAAIREQRLNIGDKLPPEREMAKAMNVSRNTLREGIAALQLLGYFEVRRSSGIYLIKQPDDDVVHEAVENVYASGRDPYTSIDARIAIEPGAAILAAKVAAGKDWDMLQKVFDAMTAARERRDYRRYVLIDNTFHRTIVKITRNRLLVKSIIPILDSMRQPIWRSMKESIQTEDVWNVSYEEHRMILNAMRSGDDYMIYRAMTGHLTRSKQRLTETMLEHDQD